MIPLPPALTTAPLSWLLPDLPGVLVAPEKPTGCPRCGTAKAFFLVRQDGALGCLGCMRRDGEVRKELGERFLRTIQRAYEES